MQQEERFKRRVGERGQVTIPIELRDRFNFRPGEEVVFTVHEEGDILLRKAETDDELAAAYQRTAQRDKKINAEWEHVSVEATEEVNSDADDEIFNSEAAGDESTDPETYVSSFSSELDLSEEVQKKANEIIDTSTEEGLRPEDLTVGYVAAAIYAASLLCNEKRTQRDVADAAGITEVTLRNCYQEQMRNLGSHSSQS